MLSVSFDSAVGGIHSCPERVQAMAAGWVHLVPGW